MAWTHKWVGPGLFLVLLTVVTGGAGGAGSVIGPVPVVDVGASALAPDGAACAPLHLRLIERYYHGFLSPIIEKELLSTVPAEVCGLPTQHYSKLTVDARRAATCASCATATAQAWLLAPGSSTHTNDFQYAKLRGDLAYTIRAGCYSFFCDVWTDIYGLRGVIELYNVRPPARLP